MLSKAHLSPILLHLFSSGTFWTDVILVYNMRGATELEASVHIPIIV